MLEIVLTIFFIVVFIATILGHIEFDKELKKGNYTDNEMLKLFISGGVTISFALIIAIIILLYQRFPIN